MTGLRLHRILDANFNRTREGLRVAEEVVRFVMDSPGLQKGFKRCRHEVQRVLEGYAVPAGMLLKARDSGGDVGRGASSLEEHRKDLAEVFLANVQRAKESLRALEEFSKLIDPKASRCLKEVRFRVYALEKKSLPKLEAIRDHLPRAALRTRPSKSRRRSHPGRRERRPAAR